MRKRILLLLLLLSRAVEAQFSGPSLGLVYDAPNKALRRISGLPGAATLGDPLITGISYAAISPDHTFAIVNDGTYKLFTSVGLRALPGDLPANSRIVFSPAGSAAAVYADTSVSLTLITGLPFSPVLQSIDVPFSTTQFALNESGSLLVSMAQPSSGESILQISAQGPPVHVLDVNRTGAIAYSPDGTTAWVADAANNTIWSVSGLATSIAAIQIAGESDGIATPVGLAVSTDGKQLWIASARTATVTDFDLSQGAAISATSCSCTLSGLFPLASPGVFRLAEVSAGPLWILDASGAAPKSLFIPAVAASPGDGQ